MLYCCMQLGCMCVCLVVCSSEFTLHFPKLIRYSVFISFWQNQTAWVSNEFRFGSAILTKRKTIGQKPSVWMVSNGMATNSYKKCAMHKYVLWIIPKSGDQSFSTTLDFTFCCSAWICNLRITLSESKRNPRNNWLWERNFSNWQLQKWNDKIPLVTSLFRIISFIWPYGVWAIHQIYIL